MNQNFNQELMVFLNKQAELQQLCEDTIKTYYLDPTNFDQFAGVNVCQRYLELLNLAENLFPRDQNIEAQK